MKKKKTKVSKSGDSKTLSRTELRKIKEDVKGYKWTVTDEKKKSITDVDRKRNLFFERGKGRKLLRFSLKGRYNMRKRPDITYIVTMMFPNGTLITKCIKTKDRTFNFHKKDYHLYYEEAWYDLSLNAYRLFYHANYVEPINREVMQKGDEAYFNVTPENVKKIIGFKYVDVIAGTSTKFEWMYLLIAFGAGIVAMYLFAKFAGGG